MSRFPMPALTRRAFLASAAAARRVPCSFLEARGQSRGIREVRLRAAPGRVAAFAGTIRRNDRLVLQRHRSRSRDPRPPGRTPAVEVENGLAEETTVHWHGVRVPNAMDGVPHLTQTPIAPGGSFVYEFEPSMPAPSGITRTSAASNRSAAASTVR